MNVLFIADVVGRAGRNAVAALLPTLKRRYSVDFVVANCENAAGGLGITPAIADELLGLGADVLTSGNHVWHRRQIVEYLDDSERILRPANYPPGAPGRGSGIYETSSGESLGLINLQGRVFMPAIDCPFRVATRLVAELALETRVIIVDFHAEATSEKVALGWYLAGDVSAVLGTHTHVQTADECILDGTTAYITDVGMTGPEDSVIGMGKDSAIARFVEQLPHRLEPASGDTMLNAVVIDIDGETGTARSIQRIREEGISQ